MSWFGLSLFLIFIAIYFGISFYIGYNGWVWINSKYKFTYKKAYAFFILLLSSSFILGRMLDFKVLDFIGGYWMVVVGYSLMVLPIANIIYFALKRKGTFKIGLGVLAFFAFIFAYGSFNAWNTIVRNYEISIDKELEQKELKVLLATDIHIGEEIGKHNLLRMVEIVKEEKPDMVLISGDILNDDINPFIQEKIGDIMKQIKAPLGVFAVPGNHDYYGDDITSLSEEMQKIGVHFLKDEVTFVNNEFYIVGRKDFSSRDRKEISELVKGLDNSKPIIMLDHQPRELRAAEKNGVDILLSGHTHKGQIFPANFITNYMYENDWGYIKKKELHSFTSSGLGLWGPALRIGSRSEVMIIDVKFK